MLYMRRRSIDHLSSDCMRIVFHKAQYEPHVTTLLAQVNDSPLSYGQNALLLQLSEHPLQTVPSIYVPTEARFPRLAHAEH